MIEPDKVLFDKIVELKKNIREKFGEQQYLQDPPHMTLYIADLPDISGWEKEFEELVRSIAREHGAIGLGITGWHEFKGDVMTGKDTLTINLTFAGEISKIQAVQMELINMLESKRLKPYIDRYSEVYDKLPLVFQQNLDNKGYPFFGEIYIPHFGLASFESKVFGSAKGFLKDKCPTGNYHAAAITVYRLVNDGSGLTLVEPRKFLLNNNL